MRQTIALLLFASAIVLIAIQPASAVTMAWSPVGYAGNASDPASGSKYGAVDYNYNIGTYHVTNAQYIEFLNAKDPTGANSLGLYDEQMSQLFFGGIRFDSAATEGSKYYVIPPLGNTGFGNRPVTFVSWYSAIRFANWLNNGQGNGSTEMGAYTLLGGTPIPSNALTIARSPTAKVFLPSEDEWYKAAYYNPATSSYYLYPTSSNSPPISSGPSSSPNHSNYNRPSGTPTDVGAYTATTSPYGVFDMGGNVTQWNEALVPSVSQPGLFLRGVRGGSFEFPADNFIATNRFVDFPEDEHRYIGFRVASVPEPSTLVLSLIGCATMWILRRRSK